MKAVHLCIFALLSFLYLAGLLFYWQNRELEHSRLSRIVRRDSLVANFSGHQEPLQKIIKAAEQNLRLAQAIRVERVELFEPWQLVAQTARFFNDNLSREQAKKLAHLITKKAENYRLDPLLMTALISQESAFRADAKSPVGAFGYGQIMPATADDLGVNRYDPEENLEGCAKYLAQQLARWRRSEDPVSLALASYNAGPGAVARYGGIPPYRETRTYVSIVTARYETLKQASREQKARNRRLTY